MGLTRSTGNTGGIFADVAELQGAKMEVNERAELSTGQRYNISDTDDGDGIVIANGNYANPVFNPENLRHGLISKPTFDLFAPNKVGVSMAGAFTNARSTVASYTDVYGVLQEAVANDLRPEADGYRFEGVATNNILHSDDIADSDWVKSNLTVITDNTTAPNGSVTADKIYPSSSGISSIRQAQSYTLNDQRSMYFIAKAGEFDVVYVDGASAVWGSPMITYFNLSNGVVTPIGAGVVDSSMEHIVDGWYLCSVSGVNSVSATNAFGFVAGLCDVVGSTTATANGTDGLFFWRGQSVALPFPTSTIATTVAPVTRTADENSAPYALNIPRGDQAFTIRFKGVIDGYTNFNRLFTTENDNVNNKFTVNMSSSGVLRLTNGGDNTKVQTNPITFGKVFEYVLTSDGVTYKSYLNGLIENVSPVTNPATELSSEIRILRGLSSTNDSYGNCSAFQAWIGKALTADEIRFIAGEE